MEIINSKYRIENYKLGEGAFSEIYLGTILSTNQLVAVKKMSLHQKNLQNESIRSKLRAEIDLLQKLIHPNIVGYYDFFMSDTCWYIIMEYCNAGTLDDVIEYNNSMSKTINFNREENTYYYLNQLKDALSYVRRSGYMHRDIKPMNVLLIAPTRTIQSTSSSPQLILEGVDSSRENKFAGSTLERADSCCKAGLSEQRICENKFAGSTLEGADSSCKGGLSEQRNCGNKFAGSSWNHEEKLIVKLADFGLARNYIENDTSLMNTLCGSPLYMAPELILKKEYNSQADLWSYGIIMYQMLFGVHPHDANNYSQLINNLKSKNIDFHSNRNFSAACYDLLKKLLTKNPNKRIDWPNFFNHKWFSYWQDSSVDSKFNRSNSDDINHSIQSKTLLKSSSMRTPRPIMQKPVTSTTISKISTPIKISTSNNNRIFIDSSENMPNYSSGSPNSPLGLGQSNLSRMKIDQFSFSPRNFTPGSYADYQSNTKLQQTGGFNDKNDQKLKNAPVLTIEQPLKISFSITPPATTTISAAATDNKITNSLNKSRMFMNYSSSAPAAPVSLLTSSSKPVSVKKLNFDLFASYDPSRDLL